MLNAQCSMPKALGIKRWALGFLFPFINKKKSRLFLKRDACISRHL
jgi:hypothetical protein